jgi:hypothetical protein
MVFDGGVERLSHGHTYTARHYRTLAEAEETRRAASWNS